MLRVALNGYGKVGQAVYQALLRRPGAARVVAVNDPSFGVKLRAPGDVHAFSNSTFRGLPWSYYNVDLVIEASGQATERAIARRHLEEGAKRVVVTASMAEPDITLIGGVNHDQFDPFKHMIISASSCTAACFAPIAKIIDQAFGIESCSVKIDHGYDPDLLDVDLARVPEQFRKSFPCGQPVPYATNFARNLAAVFPQLADRITAKAFYVPHNRYLLIQAEAILREKANYYQFNWAINSQASPQDPSAGVISSVLNFGEYFPLEKKVVGNPYTLFFSILTSVEQRIDRTARGHKVSFILAGDYISGYAERVADLVGHLS